MVKIVLKILEKSHMDFRKVANILGDIPDDELKKVQQTNKR